jgi:hypothetical protein
MMARPAPTLRACLARVVPAEEAAATGPVHARGGFPRLRKLRPAVTDDLLGTVLGALEALFLDHQSPRVDAAAERLGLAHPERQEAVRPPLQRHFAQVGPEHAQELVPGGQKLVARLRLVAQRHRPLDAPALRERQPCRATLAQAHAPHDGIGSGDSAVTKVEPLGPAGLQPVNQGDIPGLGQDLLGRLDLVRRQQPLAGLGDQEDRCRVLETARKEDLGPGLELRPGLEVRSRELAVLDPAAVRQVVDEGLPAALVELVNRLDANDDREAFDEDRHAGTLAQWTVKTRQR